MDITTWVLDRAEADDALDEAAKLVVLAALEGDSEVDQALDASDYAGPDGAIGASETGPPVRAFLKSITVQGFRGIGAKATLGLNPAPGLVVVAGRNGSGKSSFAEALEIALTGGSYRWARRSALWHDSWRNLHQPTPCQIEIELAAETTGRTVVGVSWDDDAPLEDHSGWVQRAGQKREPGLASLGWRQALELYRPMLSYDELSGMLEAEPSKLFDALESFLGLEQLTDAGARLSARVKTLGQPDRDAKAKAINVKGLLTGVTDVRAIAVAAQLKKRTPDLDAVRELVTGSSQIDPHLETLRGLARLCVPADSELSAAAEELRAAAADYVGVSERLIDAAADRLELLTQALAFHSRHGGGTCPVCGAGLFDDDWAVRAGSELEETRAQSQLISTARNRLAQARAAARELIQTPPATLDYGALGLASLPAARQAWHLWAQPPADDAGLVLHLLTGSPVDAVQKLRAEVDAEIGTREDAWAAIAVPLASWLDAARLAAGSAAVLRLVDTAAKWIATNTATLRNQRLEPLAEQARHIWAELRQESNVDLGSVRLEGAKTRRRVDLRARVDGTETGALPVMSQGELHALALALFIPRASSVDSPFGFIVLDDPIQAMDPSKIDGFVRVLTELAADRQVIVFSHDDRLPEAVRRAVPQARILEIARGNGSALTVVSTRDPAERYLADAWTVASDAGLSVQDKARVIPGLCRLALEAACRDVYYGRQLSAGASRGDVEAAWQAAVLTRQRVQLAVDPKGANLDLWLAGKPWRLSGLGICTSALHGGLRGDPQDAVERVRKLVNEVRALR